MNGQKVQKSNLHFWLHIQRLFSCSAVRFSCSADLFSCSAMGFNPYPPKSSQDSCARTCNIIVMVPLLLCQGSENVSTPSPPPQLVEGVEDPVNKNQLCYKDAFIRTRGSLSLSRLCNSWPEEHDLIGIHEMRHICCRRSFWHWLYKQQPLSDGPCFCWCMWQRLINTASRQSLWHIRQAPSAATAANVPNV